MVRGAEPGGPPPGAVVVGVDASASARRAAHLAAHEAVLRGAPLHVVHVVPWPNPGATATRYADAVWVDELRRSADQLVEGTVTALSPLLAQGSITTAVARGNPVAHLVAAAERASLLVVGARGIGGVTGLVVGSTATAVAAHAPCPVVVLPDQDATTVSGRRSVVVGVAGDDRDDEVLTFAFTSAALRRTDLVALHAWGDPVPFHDVLVDAGAVAAAEQRLLAEAVVGHRDKEPDVVVREVACRDRTARALIGASRAAELLVVGREHGGPLRRLGSTAHAVLHGAGCPVAVVPAGWTGGRP